MVMKIVVVMVFVVLVGMVVPLVLLVLVGTVRMMVFE